jgi:hypothetical protein
VSDARKHDIFDGSWEDMFSGKERKPGMEPTYQIPIPEKWPVERFYQVVVHQGQWAQRVVEVWLN